MENINPYAKLLGRILIAAMFVMAGFSKIGGYEGTQGYMAAMGVPGGLLPVVIALEIGGGLAVLIGWQTRIAAFLLGGFSALAALIFHLNPGDQMQMILFMKDFAIAGGFLFLVADGPGALSIDGWRARRSA